MVLCKLMAFQKGGYMLLLSISIAANIILSAALFFVNRCEKKRKEKKAEVEMITDKLLQKQIEILRKGDYATSSVELEISKYIKDVLVKSLVTGEFMEFKKNLLPPIVLSECPDIFQEK